MSSSTNNSLRPAWNRGGNSKGFQPPPAVASERSLSTGTSQPQQQRDNQNYNKFAALDLEDDDEAAVALAINEEAGGGHRPRSVKGRSASVGTASAASTTSGRSLADLAARTPATTSGEPRRFSALRSSEEVSGSATTKQEAKVIRFTRERLLSMRPAQSLHSPPAKLLQELEGSVILSLEPQDPVCWDTFDAEEIWAAVPPRRGSIISNKEQAQGDGGMASSSSTLLSSSTRRLSSTSTAVGGGLRRESSSSLGRWQRGVALPPPDSSATAKPGGTTRRLGTGNSRDMNADNPNDLWDDPVVPADGGNGAANDFSAFGTLPMDDNEPFDFEKMAEASRKLEEELHGHRSRTSSTATAPQEESASPVHATTIDASRPLASAGTTIRSGSGDMVNVFEDFDDEPVETVGLATSGDETGTTPPSVKDAGEHVPIQNADADPNASSRLMAMIGVQKDESVASDPKLSAWGSTSSNPMVEIPAVIKEKTTLAGIPLNPWGDPILGGGVSNGAQSGIGLDLQAQFREAELKQKAEAEARRREQEELLRRQQEQQQQLELEQERQRQQQQQAGVQSQVEMVLMERISTILESSWGRSDLGSILSTLHAEDSRVIPLLSNVDALRALLLRNPRRVALRQDPALRAEMAALLITNAQWQQQQQQQQQQQHALQQQQEEELQRREQRRRMEAEQAAAVAAARQRIVPDAPWYYSDPSKNIQGPFRGEEMRQWFEAGYFKGDLPISQSPHGPFRPLATIFNDLSAAFVFTGRNEEEQRRQEAEKLERQRQQERDRREIQERQEQERLASEQQLREQQAREQQQLREQQQAREQQLLREQKMREQHALEQQERAKAEAAAAAKAQKQANGTNNESSNQLKLMLGLGAQGSTPEKMAPPQAKGEEEKAGKKKLQQPAVELNLAAAAATPLEPTKSAAPAWGGAAVSKPVARKSMSEIQMEEARAAAVAAMNSQGSRSSGSGWANVAASRGGSTGWSGGSAMQKPTATALAITPGAVQPQQRALSMQPNSSIAAANAQLAASQVGKMQRSSSTSATDSADAFGAKMSADLERWCKDQMSRLNGTDDLTLVGFCMTLNDAEEIRQYLTAYLGSTPQVNAFATEFINRKGNPQGKQEEWESTVPVKKGRKKKAGAR